MPLTNQQMIYGTRAESSTDQAARISASRKSMAATHKMATTGKWTGRALDSVSSRGCVFQIVSGGGCSG